MFLESPGPNTEPAAVILPEDEAARRPPNAFILFCRAVRPSICAENPAMSDADIYGLIGKMWQLTDESLRAFYREQAKTLAEAYRAAHPDYEIEKRKRPAQLPGAKAPEPIRLKVLLEDGAIGEGSEIYE
jgi:hypothetical protein